MATTLVLLKACSVLGLCTHLMLGNPLQYSCLGNPMDREAWWARVHGVARVRHNLTTKLPTTTHIQSHCEAGLPELLIDGEREAQ